MHALQIVVSLTFVLRWLTLGLAAHTVVWLITHNLTVGLSRCYSTLDCTVRIGSVNASMD